MIKRIVAVALTVLMLVSVVSVTAFASSGDVSAAGVPLRNICLRERGKAPACGIITDDVVFDDDNVKEIRSAGETAEDPPVDCEFEEEIIPRLSAQTIIVPIA